MKIKKTVFSGLLFLGISLPVFGQLNPYKYVVVPTHFEDYRKSNQYQTSTVIKYLFTELKVPAVYDTQQPTELKIDPCLGAYVRLIDTSGMFLTRVQVQLVDCEGKVVVETLEGTSKLKDYNDAYKEALRNAFISFDGLAYQYQPKPKQVTESVNPVTENSGGVERESNVVTDSTENALSSSETELDTKAENSVSANQVLIQTKELLYAQPIENGFQLIDNKPSVRMILVNTSKPDIFLVIVNGVSQGTVFKEGDKWIHESLDGTALKRDILQIKF
jgi:hypothetical protein